MLRQGQRQLDADWVCQDPRRRWAWDCPIPARMVDDCGRCSAATALSRVVVLSSFKVARMCDRGSGDGLLAAISWPGGADLVAVHASTTEAMILRPKASDRPLRGGVSTVRAREAAPPWPAGTTCSTGAHAPAGVAHGNSHARVSCHRWPLLRLQEQSASCIQLPMTCRSPRTRNQTESREKGRYTQLRTQHWA